jgi:putative ABC transport system substrate-binding protein
MGCHEHGGAEIAHHGLARVNGGTKIIRSLVVNSYLTAGGNTGRILKGEKPSDLPVMQPIRFEFVINMQTARLLDIDVPAELLAVANEAIE